MKILLSNDDGYLAPGLKYLAETVCKVAEVTVVAPDRNRSGASNSITLSNPVRAKKAENGFYFIEGTPVDCAYIGINGLMENEPDMVISGINAGANLGDDVLYSGTVGAAMEGRFLGMPAIAVSLVATKANNYEAVHYETAAKAVLTILNRIKEEPLPQETILNVNVPDVPWDDIQGFESTRLGSRRKPDPAVRDTDPYGREIFWIGPVGLEEDAGPGTDFCAIRNARVSLSPLRIDLTRHSQVNELKQWVCKMEE